MTIEFGNWRLVPVDRRNWELCHLHVSEARGRHGGGTEPTWHRLGRFYQHNTLAEALRYAVSRELMERNGDEATLIWDALHEYERIERGLAESLLASLSDATDAPWHVRD